MTVEYQLVELLLLTLSNLFFLPAILISIHRRYWQEGIIFTIAMATSTVYHACDQFNTQKYYCIADYDTLQFADFLAATSAVNTSVFFKKIKIFQKKIHFFQKNLAFSKNIQL